MDGFRFSDLFDSGKLAELDQLFLHTLRRIDPDCASDFERYRTTQGKDWQPEAISDVLIRAGRVLDAFLAELFEVEGEASVLREKVISQKPVFRFKREFIQRRVWKKFKPGDVAPAEFMDLDRTARALLDAARTAEFAETVFGAAAGRIAGDEELFTAELICRLLDDESTYRKSPQSDSTPPIPTPALERLRAAFTADPRSAARPTASGKPIATDGETAEFITEILSLLERWSFARFFDPVGRKSIASWVSYLFPEAMNYAHLVEVQRPMPDLAEEMRGPEERYRRRDGFALTDPRYPERRILSEVDYCIFCHERDKDSCSKGLREKTGALKRNPLGVPLTGCPLDEKISEMHLLKNEGRSLAALATVMIDNPMCPGTGHRICNDCMKSCIYQKQEPVNIPQIETAVLTDVLALPFGYEIYSLLARWNPLNAARPYALPYNGKNVLVVGLGPAGYTLAHYLVNEGFGVIGIDGLKIEPPDSALSGEGRAFPAPVRSYAEISTELDRRAMAGFGGVSEYGITVRWDKNFLTVLHLTLARRKHFRMYGGVRFGGTLTIEDAWEAGFDHIAIATGAGRPTIVDVKNNMCRGMRMASDFLMALQLTGAAKRDSLANLQVQLPALVIGGGLTAIDTATELMAYYPVQVEKIRERYRALVETSGEDAVRRMYTPEELEILDRFLTHAGEIAAERARAAAAGEAPDFIPLLRRWGGVRIAYRKEMTDSPAYRLNHEEIIKALEEGISFIECLSPVEAKLDVHGAIESMVFERQRKDENGKWRASGETVTLPARSVMVAAGTSPNTIIGRENPGLFTLDRWNQFFRQYVLADEDELREVGENETGFFTSYHSGGRYISYFGDNHPVFAGNVVKAMASAREGYRQIARLLARDPAVLDPADQAGRDAQWEAFRAKLDDRLLATVVEVIRHTPTIVEVVIKARAAAEKFHPGQFYRLQNYEARARSIAGTRLTMEGLALTGAWVDRERGLLSMIVLEMGTSSRLCAALTPGETVVVMGPTGAPTEIPRDESVLLAGGGLGNAVLFSIARALTDNGCKVLYFAGYKNGEDLYKREEIEASTTQVVWSTDAGAEIVPHRPQDAHFRGNIVQAMKAYADGQLGETLVPLDTVKRVIAIGSDRMMEAVKNARHGVLAPYLRRHTGIGSINSPMQCMMKEICAQCLQRHIDPETGKEHFVFSCYFQDQELDVVDWKNLNDRLRQNTVMEKLSNKYLDYLLSLEHVPLV